MAKTQRRWIVGTKRDSTSNIFTDLIQKPDEALAARYLPYDSTTSIYEAISNINAGITGAPGPSGATGLASAPPGVTGLQGLQGQTGIGKQGLTGISIIGATGLFGATGVKGNAGVTGVAGIQGSTGLPGSTGIQGVGVTGSAGTTGVIGLSGATGINGLGATGVRGATGLSAQNYIFNPVSRYAALNTAGKEVWIVSSSTVYTGLTWVRSGTTLTFSRSSHGHSIGNRVIVRNTNMDYQETTIDSTALNSFNITTTNTGSTYGDSGGYSLGFTYAHSGSPSTDGGTVSAPSGDHADCQLLSMRIRTGLRAGTTYNLVVPASSINGAGTNTSLGNCFVPDFNVRSDTDYLVGVGATMTTNILGSLSTFQFGALGGTQSKFIVVHF